jgi:hypothetical protein
MQRRNLITAFAVALTGWISKAALPVAAQGNLPIAPDGPATPNKKTVDLVTKRNLDKQRKDWIAQVAAEFATLRVGSSADDLLKIAYAEGGIVQNDEKGNEIPTYAYRGCSFIKVSVVFKQAPAQGGKPGELLIAKISRPFIEPFNAYD